MPGKVVIEVKPNGDIVWEVKGVKGRGCIKSTDWLEKALGGRIKSRVFKKDYHEVVLQQIKE
jgi:hypothetical protein